MKKTMIVLACLLFVGFARAQTDSVQYSYYPDANVYYNEAAKTYLYQDSASKSWQSADQLPKGYSVDANSKKNSFYYNGPDVWKANASHMKQYGSKSKPKK